MTRTPFADACAAGEMWAVYPKGDRVLLASTRLGPLAQMVAGKRNAEAQRAIGGLPAAARCILKGLDEQDPERMRYWLDAAARQLGLLTVRGPADEMIATLEINDEASR